MNRIVTAAAVVLVGSSIFAAACSSKSASPTASPTPEATATATPMSGDAYVSAVKADSQQLSQSFQKLSKLLKDPKVHDANWRSQVNAQLATSKDVYNRAKTLSPPSAYKPFQSAWLKALSMTDEISRNVSLGIDQANNATIARAEDQVSAANALLDSAMKLLP